MAKDWRKLEYFVPIKEVLKSKDEFLIRGVAINETTTRNNVRYKAEELSVAAPTLRNKPILKDHDNSVDSIVGKTTENVYYNNVMKRIEFEGIIKDKKMQEMINDGLIGSVSVGAMVKDLKKEESAEGDSYMVAQGIDFVEISLVAVPADPGAGFEKAIAESFKLKKDEEAITIEKPAEPVIITEQISDSTINVENKELGGIKMSDEVSEAVKTQMEEKARVLEEQNASLSKKVQEYAEKEMIALRNEYSELAKEKGVSVKEGYEKLGKEIMEVLIETIKSIKAPDMKVSNETLKGEIVREATPVVEDKAIFTIEKSDLGKGFSIYAESIDNPMYKWRA